MDTFKLALYLKKNSRFSLTDLAQKRKELERLSNFDTCKRFDTLKGYGVCAEETLKYILRQQQKKTRYQSIRGVLIDWMDYLKDCNELGLSLEDTAVLTRRTRPRTSSTARLPSTSISLLTLLQRTSRTFWSSIPRRSLQRFSSKKGGLKHEWHSF